MNAKRRRGRDRSNLAFVLPLFIIGVAVLYAIYSSYQSASGSLEIATYLVGANGQNTEISAVVLLDGHNITGPASLTLPIGDHTVSYYPHPWYVTPSTKVVTVISRTAASALGYYRPAAKVIGAGQTSFNLSSVSALHGVTPVVWVNTSNALVVIQTEFAGNVPLSPGDRYTYVFPSPGEYKFWIFQDTSVLGTVTVY